MGNYAKEFRKKNQRIKITTIKIEMFYYNQERKMVFDQEILNYSIMTLKNAKDFPEIQTFVSAMIAFECHVRNVSFISVSSLADKVGQTQMGKQKDSDYSKISSLSLLCYDVLSKMLYGTEKDVNDAMESLKHEHVSFVFNKIL